MATGYWSELWEDWFRPLSQDFLKTLSIFAVLYVIWEVINLMRWRGYPSVYLDALEKADFAIMWAALVVLGAMFVFKSSGIWKKQKRR